MRRSTRRTAAAAAVVSAGALGLLLGQGAGPVTAAPPDVSGDVESAVRALECPAGDQVITYHADVPARLVPGERGGQQSGRAALDALFEDQYPGVDRRGVGQSARAERTEAHELRQDGRLHAVVMSVQAAGGWYVGGFAACNGVLAAGAR